MTKEQVRHHLARLEMMMAEENKKFNLSYEKALGIVDKQIKKANYATRNIKRRID